MSIRLEFVALCRVCGVPAPGVLLVGPDVLHGFHVDSGGELYPEGWTCNGCAERLAAAHAGDGAR